MSEAPSILHADADAFFASVEQRDDPGLRGRPTIVGAGVVMAASYEARACGVEGGMSGWRARRLCPDAVVVPPRFSAYVEASRGLFNLFEETAPLVEGLSLEEAFMDVRGLERISGSPQQIAERLRRRAREQVGLALTVGVARTKVLAKMASRAAKPDGLLVIDPDREAAFLRPLPVEALWGVGLVTAERLRAHGISTVGELERREEWELSRFLG
ncbi:MAG TPA: DNA polymerase IV, partial [Solirubrobacterales bacterium]